MSKKNFGWLKLSASLLEEIADEGYNFFTCSNLTTITHGEETDEDGYTNDFLVKLNYLAELYYKLLDNGKLITQALVEYSIEHKENPFVVDIPIHVEMTNRFKANLIDTINDIDEMICGDDHGHDYTFCDYIDGHIREYINNRDPFVNSDLYIANATFRKPYYDNNDLAITVDVRRDPKGMCKYE